MTAIENTAKHEHHTFSYADPSLFQPVTTPTNQPIKFRSVTTPTSQPIKFRSELENDDHVTNGQPVPTYILSHMT